MVDGGVKDASEDEKEAEPERKEADGGGGGGGGFEKGWDVYANGRDVVCGPLSPPVKVEGRLLFNDDEEDASVFVKGDPFGETIPKRRCVGRSLGGIFSRTESVV